MVLFLVVFQKVFLEGGNKGCGNRAFCKEAAEQVRQHKGDGKGVGKCAGSKKARLCHFA